MSRSGKGITGAEPQPWRGRGQDFSVLSAHPGVAGTSSRQGSRHTACRALGGAEGITTVGGSQPAAAELSRLSTKQLPNMSPGTSSSQYCPGHSSRGLGHPPHQPHVTLPSLHQAAAPWERPHPVGPMAGQEAWGRKELLSLPAEHGTMSDNSSFLLTLSLGRPAGTLPVGTGHWGCRAPAGQEGRLCPHSDMRGKVMPHTPAAGDSRHHHQLRSPGGFLCASVW